MSLISVALRLIAEDPAYRWDRFRELYELTEGNPELLIEDCQNGFRDIHFDLGSYQVGGIAAQRVEDNDDIFLQDIDEPTLVPTSTTVNADYFAVELIDLPKNADGSRMTPQEFFDYFRLNINEFAPYFQPYDDPTGAYDDDIVWNSNYPVPAILNIQLQGEEIVENETDGDMVQGDVICGQAEPCCWVFSTIKTRYYGRHPVSGNRMFGYTYEPNDDGQYIFTIYTAGVDRTTKWPYYAPAFRNTIYRLGDDFWRNMLGRIISFATAPGRDGTVNPAHPNGIIETHRPNWSEVRDILLSNRPLNLIPCRN